MPAGKQSDSTRDPNDPNYRFYKPIHFGTKPSPHSKRGWGFRQKPDIDQPGRGCFEALDADHRIVWGQNENKIPQTKTLLHEVATQVLPFCSSDC
jgi:adenine-specific DNA-methyltransferase